MFKTGGLLGICLVVAFCAASTWGETVAYWPLDDPTGGVVTDVVGGYDLQSDADTVGELATPNLQTTDRGPDPVPNPDAAALGAGDAAANAFAREEPTLARAESIAGNHWAALDDGDTFQMVNDRSFTFEGWMKVADQALEKDAIIGGDRGQESSPENVGWSLWMRANGTLEALIFNLDDQGSLNPTQITTTQRFDDGAFHHVAMVWDHDAGDEGEIRVYVDGGLEASGAGPTGGMPAYTSVFALGAKVTMPDVDGIHWSDDAWPGILDEVRFSDVALDTTEFLNAASSQPASIPEPSALGVLLITSLLVGERRGRKSDGLRKH